jgi:RNA polymerase subunit RPABC4/transcription elongation factor Spt4
MADTWITDITHFLDKEGEIISEPAQARKLAEYFAAIIVMASFLDPDYPTEYRVLCRRRPNRKPCQEEIAGFVEPETDNIVWVCPACGDGGLISNWRGTIWDMTDSSEVVH